MGSCIWVTTIPRSRLREEWLEGCSSERNLGCWLISGRIWASSVPTWCAASWPVSRITWSAGLGQFCPQVLSTGESAPWVLCSVMEASQKHWFAGVCPELVKGLESESYKEWLRELGEPWRKRGSEETSLPSILTCSKVAIGLLCHVSSESMRGNGLKLWLGRFRNQNFIESLVRHWNKLYREVVESLSLELF